MSSPAAVERTKRAVVGFVVLALCAASSRLHAESEGYGKAENDVVLHRQGFGIGVAAGPGQLLGLGRDNATGTGGVFSLRVGTTADEYLSWFLQIDTIGYLIERPVLDGQGMIVPDRTKVTSNQSVVTSVGAQFFTPGALWFKVGAGVGVFTARADKQRGPVSERVVGFAGTGSVGIDLLRRGTFALDLEFVGDLGIYGDGLIGGGGLLLGINWY